MSPLCRLCRLISSTLSLVCRKVFVDFMSTFDVDFKSIDVQVDCMLFKVDFMSTLSLCRLYVCMSTMSTKDFMSTLCRLSTMFDCMSTKVNMSTLCRLYVDCMSTVCRLCRL